MDKATLLTLHCEEIPPSRGPLDADRLSQSLKAVPEWKVVGKRLERKFTLKNFLVAMDFVNAVARLAENEQHHPDILIHYNHVTLSLWTHTVGGVTSNDFILAVRIDAIHESNA